MIIFFKGFNINITNVLILIIIIIIILILILLIIKIIIQSIFIIIIIILIMIIIIIMFITIIIYLIISTIIIITLYLITKSYTFELNPIKHLLIPESEPLKLDIRINNLIFLKSEVITLFHTIIRFYFDLIIYYQIRFIFN